jgi:hypothetical protein
MSSQEDEPQPAPTGAPHRRDTGDIKPPTRDDGPPPDPNEGNVERKIDDTDA